MGVSGGGHLPVHLLCLNDNVTEHSEAILRLVIHAYEDCVEKPGMVGARKVQPLSMICEGRHLSVHSLKMFKRLLEVCSSPVVWSHALVPTVLYEWRAPHGGAHAGQDSGERKESGAV